MATESTSLKPAGVPSSSAPTQPTNVSGSAVRQTTLDESVLTTISRDLKEIGTKLYLVLIPRKHSTNQLRNWDLWGPLLLCMMLAIMLSVEAPHVQSALVFSAVFVIIWCGSGVVTINALLLGGHISVFQSVCVLGYCIFPLNLACLLGIIIKNFIAHCVITAIGFVYSTIASVPFIGDIMPPNRKALAVYPVFLFYLCIAWMILIGVRT
mmetsp:Transcript_24656/g.40596  ORF Transcript_24656/g.40596 Transcript_24656/m.40596 type:complete len:210 (+) Transcript_24656:116-745(+)